MMGEQFKGANKPPFLSISCKTIIFKYKSIHHTYYGNTTKDNRRDGLEDRAQLCHNNPDQHNEDTGHKARRLAGAVSLKAQETKRGTREMTNYDLSQLPDVRAALRQIVRKHFSFTGMGYSIVDKFEDMIRQEEQLKKEVNKNEK